MHALLMSDIGKDEILGCIAVPKTPCSRHIQSRVARVDHVKAYLRFSYQKKSTQTKHRLTYTQRSHGWISEKLACNDDWNSAWYINLTKNGRC